VLTVPRRAADTKLRFKHILCPVDFSDSSRDALRYALSLAQESDARLVVAHVVELLSDAEIREYRMFTDPGYRANIERAAREQIAAAIPDTARRFCAIDEVVVVGRAYKEILRLAETRQADLIVIGVHGRGAADLMLFGSTTQHVVRQAICPVLTLRHLE
jgi:nucleotide-binding universal stress UspA family protein